MDDPEKLRRFKNLDFARFKELAADPTLSKYERIGFPDSYRAGYEEAIFADICRKLPALEERGKTVVDIGPGCSDLPRFLVEKCRAQGHRLVLVDSAPMLAQLPRHEFVDHVEGMFPLCMPRLENLVGRVDAVLCYSVLHYAVVDTDVFDFLDQALRLLRPGGRLLIGDVPNLSMRRRFFASEAGIRHHKAYTGRDELPDLAFNDSERGAVDDALVFGLLTRARAGGIDAYVLPQAPDLPMANRREDLLFARP